MQTQQTPQSPLAGNPNLARLHDLDKCQIADGEPDIRGWSVRTSDGRDAGKVDELIVDTRAMKVRYMDVVLDRKSLGLKEERHVIVPLSNARLDDDRDDVLLGSTTATQLMSMGEPASMRDMPADADVSRFYGKRGNGEVQRMTLSEEEMRVGKRTHRTGEVDVRKHVETRHVEKNVPLTHEEVTIQRRALPPDASTNARISEDEIRIPLTGEEAVVEKRTVPREEVVIRKTAVQGEQTVSADLRREEVDVKREGDTGKSRGGADGSRSRGSQSRR